MKVAFPYSSSRAGYLKSMEKAFVQLGFETISCKKYNTSTINKSLRKLEIFSIAKHADYKRLLDYNRDIYHQLEKHKPDYFFNYSGSNLLPETVKNIRNNLGCATICFVADNPCDPLPKRDKYFPMTLQYYDILLLPELIWSKIIRNVAPRAKIIPFYGGYDSDLFYTPDNEEITDNDKTRFGCELSFTGGSYGDSPEGAYRAGILGLLTEFELKIWGDSDWKWRFPFYPKLKESYRGNRLSYNDLRKAYAISTINLNIPSPMLFTGFQPRVFEIAACKGFQIVDHTDELFDFFDKDEIVTFKNTDDLRDKIGYYLKNEPERNRIIEKMNKKTLDKFTWEKQINLLVNQL